MVNPHCAGTTGGNGPSHSTSPQLPYSSPHTSPTEFPLPSTAGHWGTQLTPTAPPTQLHTTQLCTTQLCTTRLPPHSSPTQSHYTALSSSPHAALPHSSPKTFPPTQSHYTVPPASHIQRPPPSNTQLPPALPMLNIHSRVHVHMYT